MANKKTMQTALFIMADILMKSEMHELLNKGISVIPCIWFSGKIHQFIPPSCSGAI